MLIELQDGLDDAESVADANRLLAMLHDVQTPVLSHGEGSSCWPALLEAGRRGLPTRIGLEDTLAMPDGNPPSTTPPWSPPPRAS